MAATPTDQPADSDNTEHDSTPTTSPTSTSPARRLLGATATMASGTLVSRLFGAARVILTGYILIPNSRQSDIFALALMVPNGIYTIVATGLVNAILVPQIVRATTNDRDGGEAYINRILTAFLLIIVAVTALATVGAPVLTGLFTGPSWQAPELAAQYQAMVTLTAFCMPQILFYGLFVLVGQVLNARGVFGPMMWAPVVNNIVQISTLIIYMGVWGQGNSTVNGQAFTTAQMGLLAGGWALALIAQLTVLLPFTRRIGFHWRPRFDFRHTGLGHTFSLAKWSLLFVGVANLALFAVTYLLMDGTISGAGAGKAVYDNAYLIFAMPHSLIAVSIATALVPSLSRLAAERAMGPFGRELAGGLRLTIAALFPFSLILIALSQAIPAAVYRSGRGSDLIGWTLLWLSLGLVPFSVQYVLQRAYFALEDTRSVFVFELIMALVWVTSAWAVVQLGQVGPSWIAPAVAGTNSLAYLIGLIVTLIHLHRRLPGFAIGALLGYLARAGLAALPGALLAGLIVWYQTHRWDSLIADILGLVTALVAAVGVYWGMAKLCRLTEVSQVVKLVRQKISGTS
jgi:putative peptidoglycan lipid II flippase